MTSEPAPPAYPAGDAPAVAAPLRAALPWRGFLLDALLGALLLIGLSLLFIVPIVFMYVAMPGADGTIRSHDAAMAAAMPAITVAAIAAMLATALLMWWLRGRPLKGTLPRMDAVPAYTLAVGAGLAVQLGAFLMMLLLAKAGAGLEPSNVEPVTALLASSSWLAWGVVVLVAPFAEELLMRHVLLRRFALAGHGAAGLVLTSVAFALMHEPVPTQTGVAAWLGGLAMYTAMGAAFAAVYLRTGRFRAAFLAHAVCNASALVLAAYSAS